jgi:hypothetical protein
MKLVMEGEGGGVGVLDDPPQPVKPARPRPKVIASGTRTERRFIGSPVIRSGKILTIAEPLQRSASRVPEPWPVSLLEVLVILTGRVRVVDRRALHSY